MTPTPETLREWAEQMWTDPAIDRGAMARCMRAAADAWEAILKDLANCKEAHIRKDADLATSEQARQRAETENRLLRQLAWISDPSPDKYGDDGELQCAGIDYLRWPVEQIEQKRLERGLAALAQTKPCPGCGVVGVNVHLLGCKEAP